MKRALRIAFAVLAVGALAVATVSQWHKVEDTIADVSWSGLALGVAATAAATYCSMLAWRAVLADLGSPLALRDAERVFFLGQLGKYLPGGGGWAVAAQMELGRTCGVPAARSARAALSVLVASLTAAGAVAAVTLPFVAELADYRWVLVLPALGLVLLHPRVLRLSPRGAARAVALSALQWLAYGVGVWAVASDLPGAPGGLLALTTGAYALAWSAGFLVLVAPAGAGVREGALVLLLTPAYGSGPALGIALLARLLATLGDLAGAARVAVVTRGTRGQDVGPNGRTSSGDRGD